MTLSTEINSPMAFPKDKGEYIWTFTGTKFYFEDPGPGIKLIDIAHHLSLLCRWTGAVKEFYSIAEHCVRCSYYPFDGPDDGRAVGGRVIPYALRKLLHDAAEAYTNDLNKPLKNLLTRSVTIHSQNEPMETVLYSEYDAIEDRIAQAIYKKYGLSPEIDDRERNIVKAADLALAMTEARDLIGQTSVTHYEGARPLKGVIKPWSSAEAEEKFLERFKELM